MILITEFMDEAAVEALRAGHPVTYEPSLADRQGDIPGLLGGVSALIVRNRTQVSASIMDAAPGLRCIGRLGVGLDNIDTDAAAARGVTVYPATGANNLSVAEYVITAAMMLLRRAYFEGPTMRAGDWPRQRAAGREIAGKTLGLVGFGAIAQQTAAMARALGMVTCAFDPFLDPGDAAWSGTTRQSLDAVLSASDVVSLHTPLTEATRQMISAPQLALMRPDAVLINAARGGVLDDRAFAAAVRDGQIAGGALDVFETEPLTADAADMFAGLASVILTPHVAGVTVESNTRVSALIADLVGAHLAG